VGLPRKPRVKPEELIDKLSTKGKLTDEEAADIPWDDLSSFVKSSGFGRESSAPTDLDTNQGQAEVLKRIINNDDEKTENVLKAISQLGDLTGTKKYGVDGDIKRLSSEELLEAINTVVIPVLNKFRVRKQAQNAV
jgi:polyhydroxyalkanoate synthesis regulator phasin